MKFGQKLGLVGWVQNTNQGTVVGQAQGIWKFKKQNLLSLLRCSFTRNLGKFNDLAALSYWLANKGSPHSNITKLELTNCRLIDKLDFNEFFVKKTYLDVQNQCTEPVSAESSEIEAELIQYGKSKFES